MSASYHGLEEYSPAPARLFWADYAYLESGGTDWIHMEMRDGDHMGFQSPRSGLDILTGTPPLHEPGD